MGAKTIQLDDETFKRLAELSRREGKPMAELVKSWTEASLIAAEVITSMAERDVIREDLKARERRARARVRGLIARDNLPRNQLYRD